MSENLTILWCPLCGERHQPRVTCARTSWVQPKGIVEVVDSRDGEDDE